MKFAVITFPGSNCDQDMIYVLRDILHQEVLSVWHKDTSLQGADFVVVPGGFSYGDYLRSGAIARFSPIMEEVNRHAAKGGYVMGVCNGFQILCEAGLLPGALLHNASRQFICSNVYITPATKNSLLTQMVKPGAALKIPVAHGEGNYYAPEDAMKKILDNDQILFKYCTQTGDVTPDANPNGSMRNIAGVCNEKRNVFGMMPHPERAADTMLGNTDGIEIFHSILSLVNA
jgi:phosphoribosylformylglycinamidine synthase